MLQLKYIIITILMIMPACAELNSSNNIIEFSNSNDSVLPAKIMLDHSYISDSSLKDSLFFNQTNNESKGILVNSNLSSQERMFNYITVQNASSQERDQLEKSIMLAGYMGAPSIQWSKTFGGPQKDCANSVQQTGDGGYIIAGTTESYGAGSEDIWIVKTNPNGDKIWDRTFGGSGSDFCGTIQQTVDGGYIIAGSTGSYGSGNLDAWIIKTDSNGNKIWDKTYGGSEADYVWYRGNSIQQTGDGGYIIAGTTASYGTGIENFWLIKIDSGGNKIWDKTFGETNKINRGRSIIQANDGGYVMSGYMGDSAWIVKTDSNGNKLWDKAFSNAGGDSIQQTGDGGYIIAGLSGYSPELVSLLKIDSSGNKIWNRIFGDNYNNWDPTVRQTIDGGYIIAASTNPSELGSFDAWLIKTDSSGNKLWDAIYGGSSSDFADCIGLTADGGYIFVGQTSSYGESNGDFWIVRLMGSTDDPYGSLVFEGIDLISKEGADLTFKKDAILKISVKNTGSVSVPESDWNFEVRFTDAYLTGEDDLVTSISKKDQLTQKKSHTIHIDQVNPGQSETILYIFKLDNDLNDRSYLGFADRLDVWGSPESRPIDYDNSNHHGSKDNLDIKQNLIGEAGPCIWDAFKLHLRKMKFVLAEKYIEGDKEVFQIVYDMQILGLDLAANGIFGDRGPEYLKNVIIKGVVLLAKLSPDLKPGAQLIELCKTLHDGIKDCFKLFNLMWFELVELANSMAYQIAVWEIQYGTDVVITAPSGEYISIINETITNNIPNSSVFLMPDNKIIMIANQGNLSIQIKGTNTSTMKIACAVPVGDNQSLYNQYTVPVIQGTTLTTTYMNTSGVEPIKVDTQGDGEVDHIKYPDVSEISPALYFPDFTDTNNANSWCSWMTIQNPNSEAVDVTIQMQSRAGDLLFQGNCIIPAHGASALRPRDLVGADCAGTAVLTSNQTIIGSCQITRNSNEMCMTYNALDRPTLKLYYADFTDTANPDSWRSWLVLQNPNPAQANISLEIRSRLGDLIYSGNRTIQARSVAAIRPRDLAGTDLSGSAAINSDLPILGTCQITRNSNKMCMSYTASDHGSTALYYPDFTDTANPDGWRSWLVLQNPSAAPANLNYEIRSRTGDLLYAGSDIIPAHGVNAVRPRNLAGADCSGSVVVTSDQPIVGTCQITRNSNEMCMSYNALDQSSTVLNYPDFTDTANPDGWRSWLVLQNPTAADASITLEIRSREGDLLYGGDQIIPAHRVNAIRPRSLVGSDCSGSAVVTSDQPLVGTCQITRNNNLMCMSYTAIAQNDKGGKSLGLKS